MDIDALVAAARAAEQADGGIRYEHEEDDIGRRACCYVLSYKDHEPDCYVTKLRAALAQAPAENAAAKHWHDLYRKECRLRQDDAARYGQQIVDLEAQALAVRELPAKWRHQEPTCSALASQNRKDAFRRCANELEAALAQSPAVRVDDVLLRVSDEDLRWCKDIVGALQEAGGPTNNMRAVGLSRLIAALEAALGQGKA